MVNWEERYQEHDTPWEKGQPAPPLRAYLAQTRIEGSVIAPGCGDGHDVRLLAGQGAHVLGVDVAPTAVKRAAGYPPVNGETYRVADFLKLPGDLRDRFDWVYENTFFCAIHPDERPVYVESVSRALRPGGRLFAVFFPRTGNPPGEGPPYPVDPAGIDALFAGRFALRARWVPAVGFPGRVGNEEIRLLERI